MSTHTVTAPPATAGAASIRRVTGWRVVALAVFVSAWGGNEFTPMLVLYRETSGLSPVVVDGLLFAYVLGIFPALLIGGPLSDRFGRRPLMLPAPILAATGSLLLALGATSAPVLTAGRIFSGLALGLSMAVGGSWIKELSDRSGAPAGVGARRAAMSLTGGFAVGAGVAGVLAQWGPWPHVLPYAINIGLALVTIVLLLRVPETRGRSSVAVRLIDDLRIPSVGHRRFLFVVLPVAPWVFGTCAAAYAIIPDLMSDRTGGAPIAFAALCCVVGLAAGFIVQGFGRRVDQPGGIRGIVVALLLVAAGMGMAVLAAHFLVVWLALLAAAVLGCGYGMAMIAGLLEVQRIAGPDDLAGLSAIYYGVTYLGFASPAIMAAVAQTWPAITYPEMFAVGIGAALICLFVVVNAHIRQTRNG